MKNLFTKICRKLLRIGEYQGGSDGCHSSNGGCHGSGVGCH